MMSGIMQILLKSYQIQLKATDFEDISGFQFTLEFNPYLIEFQKIRFRF